MSTSLRVIQYNIESCLGVTRGYYQYITEIWKSVLPHSPSSLSKIGHYLSIQQSDITFLTEVDNGSFRSSGMDQLKTLSAAMGAEGVFFPTNALLPFFSQGNAIISRHKCVASRSYDLSGHGERRTLGEVELNIEGHAILAYVTHLSLNSSVRKEQIQAIADIISRQTKPIILGGDFNAYDSQEMRVLHQRGFRYATGNTYPSWSPFRQLDYIYFSSSFDLVGSSVYIADRFSDHAPLIAQLVQN
jgi:endonuclease/exonuclease/phosphatase family metal-dependent hydrolase